MKQFFSFISSLIICHFSFSQNVGVGIGNPIGKVHIQTVGDTAALMLQFNSTSSSKNVLDIKSSGTGPGLAIDLSNLNSNRPAMSISYAGFGTGIKLENSKGIGIEVTTASMANPSFLGTNSLGEVVVAKSTANNNIAAIVGRNDAAGVGVKGMNTASGAGLIGEATTTSTGRAAIFRSLNSSNTLSVVEISGSGSGSLIDLNTTNINGSSPAARISSAGSTRPQLMLHQQAVLEYSRIRMSNANNSINFWDIASFSSVDASNAEMNFFFKTSSVNGLNTLSMKGNGNVTIAGVLTENSDSRLKQDIIPLSRSLEKITSIGGYNYFWKDAARDRNLQTGLIAQEVEKQMPELVHEDNEGIKSVNYNGVISHLIEAIKTQQRQIDELKKKVEELSNRESK